MVSDSEATHMICNLQLIWGSVRSISTISLHTDSRGTPGRQDRTRKVNTNILGAG